MARPSGTLPHTDADDEFLPEGEVFPAETVNRPPTIIEVAKDEDTESLFLPEVPSAVVVRVETAPRRSVFAYDPDLILRRGPAPVESRPAIQDAWPLPSPPRIQSAPRPWGLILAVAVLLPV